MLKFLAAIGLGAVMALPPLAAAAQTPAPAAEHQPHAQKFRGSHRNEMRRHRLQGRDAARASAEHVRTMRNQ